MTINERFGISEDWDNGRKTNDPYRLFAAAPDLLEALTELVADYDGAHNLPQSLLNKLAKADSAIKKARGAE